MRILDWDVLEPLYQYMMNESVRRENQYIEIKNTYQVHRPKSIDHAQIALVKCQWETAEEIIQDIYQVLAIIRNT